MKKETLPYTFGEKGKIYSYTVVHKEPKDMDSKAPFVIAIIELDEESERPVRLTAELTDLDYSWEDYTDDDGVERKRKKFNIKIGMPVEMVTRKLKYMYDDDEKSTIDYGYKFRPLLQPNH